MDETLTIVKFKTCFGCNYQSETTEIKCPNCRKPLWDESKIRTTGGVLMFLGTLLIGVMGMLMIWMNNVIVNTNRYSSTTKWTGSAERAQIGFLVMGLVMAFGISAFIAGTWQWITGKRNKILIWLMIGIWIVLIIAANVIPNIF